MQKIPTLFLRGDDHNVIDEFNPVVHDFYNPNVIATRKYDGQCCLWLHDRLFKRHEVKKGKEIPEGFHQFGFPLSHAQVMHEAEPVSPTMKAEVARMRSQWHREITEEPSTTTDGPFGDQGPRIREKLIGWKPVGTGPEDQYFNEALRNLRVPLENKQTYELIGPKVQGNPEDWTQHELIPHGETRLLGVPLTYALLKDYLCGRDIEGIVWHMRMPEDAVESRRDPHLKPICKLKLKDFGLPRKPMMP